jgi:hypothetical protein
MDRPRPKNRKDTTDQAQLRLADKSWAEETRPTANKKNVKTRDGLTHAVYWLETTEFNFYREHIKRHNLFYPCQLLVRGISTGTSAAQLRSVFSRFGNIISIKIIKKYAYVTFSLETSVKEALKQAGRTGRDLEVNTDRKTSEVSQRPLIGFTIFRSRRPFRVLPVGRSTCGCITCYGMRLVFTALMDFDQWENVCPQVFELVLDVRRHA